MSSANRSQARRPVTLQRNTACREDMLVLQENIVGPPTLPTNSWDQRPICWNECSERQCTFGILPARSSVIPISDRNVFPTKLHASETVIIFLSPFLFFVILSRAGNYIPSHLSLKANDTPCENGHLTASFHRARPTTATGLGTLTDTPLLGDKCVVDVQMPTFCLSCTWLAASPFRP